MASHLATELFIITMAESDVVLAVFDV